MVYTPRNDSDTHRTFMMEPVTEHFSRKWADAPSDTRILYSSDGTARPDQHPYAPISPAYVVRSPFERPKKSCTAVASKQFFNDKNRKLRQCIFWWWEDRYPTEVTGYYVIHGVCMCKGYFDTTLEPYMCHQATGTCWEKFHRFYTHKNVFSTKRRLQKTSQLCRLKTSLKQGIETASEMPRSVVRQVDL
ncbi:hypothetical protein JG687_00010292 [Phytophthora cactorum]|uniref:Uncharacterized protein n=1 Tax=Phytophthora cactorum TaxID=29920 RepID=A0A8T1U9Y4_9STRA|nr:hypothetical protein JG687_00010292 [Phytophthora cactorum]